jgi:hypothetical protein
MSSWKPNGCQWPSSCGLVDDYDCERGCTILSSVSFSPIEQFAAVDEPGATPLVVAAQSDATLRAVIPAGGLVLEYGDGGAGKTTKLIDVACHLAAGAEWCGVLSPVRPLRIAWIEAEGPRPMMRAKFRAKLAAWQGPPIDGRLLVLDEPWAQFTFRNERLRWDLTTELDRHLIDLVIAGPLGRLGMEGGGTTDEIREFLKLVESVQADCEIKPAVLIVHHENRAGQVSGAWEREPDTLIHVQGQGHGRTRVHWQKVRWASDLHGTSTQLVWAPGDTFTVEDKPEVTVDSMAAELIDAVRVHPGASWSKVRPLVRGNDGEKADVRDRLIRNGALVNTAARQGHFNLCLSDDPAATRAEASTGLARLSFPLGAGADEPSRATVPYVSRHGARNGTASTDTDDLEHHHENDLDAELDRLHEKHHDLTDKEDS